jgi:hypothetical protein
MRVLSVKFNDGKFQFQDLGYVEMAQEREIVVLSNGALVSLFPESMETYGFSTYSWNLEEGTVALIGRNMYAHEVDMVREATLNSAFRIIAFNVQNEVIHTR